jgi:hypothetical protein
MNLSNTTFLTSAGHGCMKSLAHTPHCRRATEPLAEVCLHYSLTSCPRPHLVSPQLSTRVRTGAPAATPPAWTTPANFYNPLRSIQFA